MAASDPDAGDTLTLSATTLPSWLSFNASNKTLSGTPTNAHVGSHNVVIKATDAAGAFVNQSFNLNVKSIITPVGNKVVINTHLPNTQGSPHLMSGPQRIATHVPAMPYSRRLTCDVEKRHGACVGAYASCSWR